MAVRGATMHYTDQLALEQCCACFMWFGMPVDFQRRRRDDHRNFHCPDGHEQHYTGPTEAQRQRKAREEAEAQAVALRDQLGATRVELAQVERSRSALKGVVTKTKKRIGRGTCPCCNRHFANVERHMETKHPEYATDPA